MAITNKGSIRVSPPILLHVCPPSFELIDIANIGKLMLYYSVILYICGVLSPLCSRALEYEFRFRRVALEGILNRSFTLFCFDICLLIVDSVFAITCINS